MPLLVSVCIESLVVIDCCCIVNVLRMEEVCDVELDVLTVLVVPVVDGDEIW